jgi:hypothetical protein
LSISDKVKAQIAEGDALEGRDEPRKFIKYNHLVANLLTYHNLVIMTKAFDEALVSGVSPYQTRAHQSIRTLRA